jgi:hypothetical protein
MLITENMNQLIRKFQLVKHQLKFIYTFEKNI